MIKFERLFEPVRIGKLELPNRIVMSAVSTKFGSDTGGVTDRYRDYYRERAKGGAGLIILENTCVEYPRGKVSPTELRIDDHKFIPALNDLAEAIKENGARAAVQLHHAGRQTNTYVTEGVEPVSASDCFCAVTGGHARALSVSEIEKIVGLYADAALRARIARFDAVEIHAAHGYLINQFLSPFTNRRTDGYGGGLEERCRFLVEIVSKIREKAGDDFPVIVRLSADEKVPEGYHLDEAKFIARKMEEIGAAILHVSAGIYESKEWIIQPMALSAGCLAHFAGEIRKVVGIPVIAVGRINDPMLAERILEEGKADLVAMGRPLIADPDLPNKARAGLLKEIRKCIACNQCINRGSQGLRIKCSVNAEVGREREYRITAAPVSKRVVVIGGGPAGMEAARVARLRGHKVVLFEKSGELGGQLRLAVQPPGKSDIKSLIDYLSNEIHRLGVQVRLGTKPEISDIVSLAPSEIVLAAGALPDVDGMELKGGRPACVAEDVLSGRPLRGNKLVVIGGGQTGCEVAHYLAKAGKTVVLVEMLRDLACEMESSSRKILLAELAGLSVQTLTGCRVMNINTDTGTLEYRDGSGNPASIDADDFVIAKGVRSNREMLDSLSEHFSSIHLIGDCRAPGNIMEAIHAGSRIGREI